MKLTFRGGIHPGDHKAETEHKPIVQLSPSDVMVYPMVQHIGAPCKPLVVVGDRVLMGQKIGDADAFVSSPIHSSVSGVVKAIEKRRHPNGNLVESVVIENDGLDEAVPEIHPYDDYAALDRGDKLRLVREAGIVGMGGAGFPTQIKLAPPAGTHVDCVIVNGAECEPYLTSDHRVMVETPKLVLDGLSMIMDILGVTQGYVGIEENKPDAISAMQQAAGAYPGIAVKTLRTKYPQGSEKHLIKAITGREVPSGKLPADVGVVVNNVDTCTAVYHAIASRRPVMSRVVTVSGSGVVQPSNFRVRIGTPFADVLAHAGGLRDNVRKVLVGGPMMGIAQFDLNVPVVKGTSAILAFTEREVTDKTDAPCIKCGKCVEKCPMGLMPLFLNAYARKGDLEKCQEYHIMDCIECGVCSYLCQCERHPSQAIKIAKQQITRRARAQGGK